MPSDQASSTTVADATTMPHEAPKEQTKFEREKHIQYLKRSLQMLPQPYTSMDTHRMTFGMFALGGLELLGVLEESVSEANRQAWIEWVYSQQRVPDSQGSPGMAAIRFIQECQTYDHGFSQSPQQESHGGSTYCAVATLGLIGGEALWDQKTMTRNVQDGEDEAAFELRKSRAGFLDKEGTRKWCLQRQTTGFQGRINKKTDTCYSFWIGASLAIMDSFDLVDFDCNRGFLLETQHKVFGGFGKWVDTYPDALHSYMGIASLSFMSEPGILPLDPLLNISKRMQERIYTQTVFWKDSR
ncbi:Geranylgeranyl transferase type-1 subunit beta [Entomortierella chlamydospora]|uniref:Geranylgeranyl transferase type-1 subunit beta n=1 Tax=Entomortierella chlamydospora TaxID=101097 RepID=A0A9P6SXJ2_9FUNG|nr:Geranylgeranyl transferase type-1 subunit beta [Entomortierella chlamydospora]